MPSASSVLPFSETVPESSTGLRVRPYIPGDEASLVEMYSAIFRERSLAEWRWLFQQGPEGPALIGILEHDGRPVGSIAHIPTSVWVDGRRLRLATGCDLMISPECRGRGGSQQLVETFLESDHGFDLNLGHVNDRSGHVFTQYAGTVQLKRARHWIRYQDRDERLPASLTRPLRVCGAVLSGHRPNLTVEDLGAPGNDVDDLARDSAGFARCIRVRDAAYIHWRWSEQPDADWRIRAVRDPRGTLRGFVVIGAVEESAGRRGVIADLLVRDYAAMRALITDAWSSLITEGCHSVTCTYHDPRWWTKRAMLRSGFIPSPKGGARMACGPLSVRAGDAVGRLESWYLTHGDTSI